MNNNLNLESENKSMLEFLLQEFKTSDTGEIQRKLSKLDKQQLQLLKAKYELWKEAKKKKLATKVAHGAKLNYIKTLKHVCPEGLELYYYKQGGNLQCGCKGKKMEEGAKVEEAKCGAVAKFKKVKKALTGTEISKQKRDSASQAKTTSNFLFTVSGMKLGYDKAQQEKKKSSSKSREDKWKSGEIIVGKDIQRGNGGPNTTKQLDNAVPNEVIPSYERKSKNTGTVAKFKSAKCGSKMKKHKLGGSLNGIPFYLGGTPKGGIKPIVLPEYKMLTGTPTILPGRYTGLERMTPGLLQMFKTWIKGLPKSLSTSDKVTIGTGTVLGNVLGYDDTHNLNIRKTANKIANKISPLIESSIEYRPFSADRLIEELTFKPKNPSFKEFKK